MTGRNPRRQCERCGAEPVVGRGLCSYHYDVARRYMHATGQWESLVVPIEPVLAHFRALRAAGVGLPRIAELSGVHRMTLDHLEDEDRVLVNRNTADRVLSVPVPTSPIDPRIADGARVPSIGSTRRVRALAAAGYSRAFVVVEINAGDPKSLPLGDLYQGCRPFVTAARARAIAELYDRIGWEPGPCEKTRRYAARHGWVLPQAWDDETIDDPDAKPLPPPKPSRKVPADFLEIVADHREHVGRTDAEIAAALGITLDALHKRMRDIDRRAS